MSKGKITVRRGTLDDLEGYVELNRCRACEAGTLATYDEDSARASARTHLTSNICFTAIKDACVVGMVIWKRVKHDYERQYTDIYDSEHFYAPVHERSYALARGLLRASQEFLQPHETLVLNVIDYTAVGRRSDADHLSAIAKLYMRSGFSLASYSFSRGSVSPDGSGAFDRVGPSWTYTRPAPEHDVPVELISAVSEQSGQLRLL